MVSKYFQIYLTEHTYKVFMCAESATSERYFPPLCAAAADVNNNP